MEKYREGLGVGVPAPMMYVESILVGSGVHVHGTGHSRKGHVHPMTFFLEGLRCFE